ncbi:hypothetical protein SAY87_023544 [Trapa incisa]|uniref:Uncharacterized protein n=1 Tax=Trapa incisa TaxID=236973 RepID=A0AAN7L3N5_9MYRT|nr:hypothetical protein SAY87_023544 [Trapa incisa]
MSTCTAVSPRFSPEKRDGLSILSIEERLQGEYGIVNRTAIEVTHAADGAMAPTGTTRCYLPALTAGVDVVQFSIHSHQNEQHDESGDKIKAPIWLRQRHHCVCIIVKQGSRNFPK